MPATSTDGFLLIDKPAGSTSHDVVAAVRRTLGISRAGHTGTLDPFATGLLIVLAGTATRLARYVPASPKSYEVTIRFGLATDTDDATGVPLESSPLPDESAVQEAVRRLTGPVAQVPPAFSAKQVDGRRAYRLARQGKPAELPPVPVVVHRWHLLDHAGDTWRFRVECEAGTYVRALARDLGRLAGSAAHATALRRTRIGPFDVSDAVSLSDLAPATPLRPALEAIPTIPRELLQPGDVEGVTHGRAVRATVTGNEAALLAPGGELVATAERVDDHWQPRVVLRHD
jgi:tRNA pseudouridine55 synthase